MGHVYCLYDPITLVPKYIGLTTHSIELRLKCHLKDSSYKKPNKRINWIKSLKNKGLSPISESLGEYDNSELSFWEQHYIWLYRSWGFNLKNATFGGEGGVKIAPYKATEETKKKISISAKKHAKEVVRKNTELGVYERAKIRMLGEENPAKKQIKPILQYTKEGVFIKEWNSIQEASIFFKVDGSNINRVCNKKHQLCLDFVWRFRGDVEIPNKINPELIFKPNHPNQLKVIQYNLDGSFIKEWESARKASNELGILSQNITSVCRGVDKTYKKFKWKYKKDV